MRFLKVSFIRYSVICVYIIGTLTSCDQPTLESKRLLWAENALKEDRVRGASMLAEISDSVFGAKDFYKYHNDQCIANVYYYRALHHLDNKDFDHAQMDFLRMVRFRVEFLKGKQPDIDSLLLNEQAWLKTIAKSNSNADSISHALKQQFLWFKFEGGLHDRSMETLTTEYRLCHSRAYWILVVFLLGCIFLVLYYHKLASRISDHQKNERRLVEEVGQLHSQASSNLSEISKLKHQLDHVQDVSNLQLGKGKAIFEKVQAGGTMKNISVEDEQSFIDYYTFAYPQQFHRLINRYSSVTLRHTTYLILSEMGYDDREIGEILYVKDSTIRNYRMRINKKKIA